METTTKKHLRDYLHFYPKISIAIIEEGAEPVSHYLEGIDWNNDKVIAERIDWDWGQIKPILRPLSSMTQIEFETHMNRCDTLNMHSYTDFKASISLLEHDIITYSRNEFLYLCKAGFDLFGLILAGLAIDAATLPLKK